MRDNNRPFRSWWTDPILEVWDLATPTDYKDVNFRCWSRSFKSSVNVTWNWSTWNEEKTNCELLSVTSMLYHSGAESFGLFSCVLDGVERQQSHRAVYRLTHMTWCKLSVAYPNTQKTEFFSMPVFRFVPRHADELCLESDDPLLILDQSEDLWCHGYNMRTGATGIFPAFYAVKVDKEINRGTLQRL